MSILIYSPNIFIYFNGRPSFYSRVEPEDIRQDNDGCKINEFGRRMMR